MAKNLVIVESPAKAKTIEQFLGPDFEVRASMGHIIDLPAKGLGVDVKHNFAPKYSILENKKSLVNELKTASKRAKTIYLAPDPDREGEFIAWALKETLQLHEPKRAVFNEITKRAVQEGIEHTRAIDENLFNAQQARRVLDRLVGYKISPLLWRRVQANTSAGRVQSVALRVICDREAEIRAFTPEEYWNITAHLQKDNQKFDAQLIAMLSDSDKSTDADDVDVTAHATEQQEHDRAIKLHITSEEAAQTVLRNLKNAVFQAVKVVPRDVRRQPPLPYTTSALQQDASVRLRFKPKKTMSLAQQLYEGLDIGPRGHQGLITYMRTDSTRVSAEAQADVKTYIQDTWGKSYVGAARAAKAKAGVQDAHEAIRPTDPTLTPDAVKTFLSADQFKLYQLVWRRFVASFMAPAVFDTMRVDITAGDYVFRATGSTLKFEGFYAVWPHDDTNDLLPAIQVGDKLNLLSIEPKQKFTQPPPRFSEASLIKELEEKGIGRPSTYVPILSTIQDRGYVEQQERRFAPTWLGETVNELMLKHFGDIVDVNFTAGMERKLDDVEEGNIAWTNFLTDFYAKLKETLAVAEKEMDRVQKPVEETGEMCPDCGKPLLIRLGRFGKFISCSGFPDCSYRRSFVLKTGALCPQCGSDLIERKSRGRGKLFYGCSHYPDCSFATWNKPLPVPCPECGGLLTMANAAREASCIKCGAVVADALSDHPQVIDHREIKPAGEQKTTGRKAYSSVKTLAGKKEAATRTATVKTRKTTAAASAKAKTPSAVKRTRKKSESAMEVEGEQNAS